MNLAIFRLSALGDATHVLAVVAAIQAQRPDWRISWIIGPGEAKLMAGLPGVNFYVYRKQEGLRGARALRRQILHDHPHGFDALLQMQLALRANLVSRMIPATRRIGFDAARSKELHSLVINERIPAGNAVHVLDVLLQFLIPLGLQRPQTLCWPFPIPDDALEFAKRELPAGARYCLLSPCASHRLRNWRADRYAQVLKFAKDELGLVPVLIGGKSEIETQVCQAIRAELKHLGVNDYIDLVGKDTLKSLLALLQRASVVISPDSGPAHMAQALGVNVVGLYAATDAHRSGPYQSVAFCTHHYAQAAQQFLGKSVERLRWGQKIEREGVMDLISVDEVCALLRKAVTS
jgi:heptosyltransferase I